MKRGAGMKRPGEPQRVTKMLVLMQVEVLDHLAGSPRKANEVKPMHPYLFKPPWLVFLFIFYQNCCYLVR